MSLVDGGTSKQRKFYWKNREIWGSKLETGIGMGNSEKINFGSC
jgi:hypothetical protein